MLSIEIKQEIPSEQRCLLGMVSIKGKATGNKLKEHMNKREGTACRANKVIQNK